jgi:hypothetical protein
MKKKTGRPANLVENKGRNIRLTDTEWKTFCDKLGPAWLRDQIKQAEAAK